MNLAGDRAAAVMRRAWNRAAARAAHPALGPYWAVAPALGVLGLFFVSGLVMGLVQSLGYFPAAGLEDWNLAHYRELFAAPEFYRSLGETIYLAGAATALSAVVSLALVLLVRRVSPAHHLVKVFLQLPLPIPHLAVGGAMVLLLSQSGLISRLAFALGWVSDPGQFPALVNDRWNVGLILVYLYKEVPFITLFLLAVLERSGEALEEAARSLGAGAWQRFRRVLLPLMLPALASASLIVFAFIVGAFELPLLLGRTYPETLAVLAYHRYTDVDLAARPVAMAVCMVIAATALAVTAGYYRLLQTFRAF